MANIGFPYTAVSPHPAGEGPRAILGPAHDGPGLIDLIDRSAAPERDPPVALLSDRNLTPEPPNR